MAIKCWATLFTLFCLSISSSVHADDGAIWGYSGDKSPELWGTLDPAYALCANGRNQSPVNLTTMIEGDLSPIAFNYQAGGYEVVNNRHSIQVNHLPGSGIVVDSHSFELKQFHFHSPSENLIEGHSFPLEAHFVHQDVSGAFAVVAVFFKEGEKNDELEKAWQNTLDNPGKKKLLSELIDVRFLLPTNRDYYRFNGSLTTPPCSEGVWWFVIKGYGSVSKEQIEKFQHIMRHPNNRPVQPLNARIILK